MMMPTPFLASGGELLFFIIAGIFLIIKWAVNKATEAAPPSTPSSSTRPPPATEEERARRFREALGLPPEEGPGTTMRAPARGASEMRRERPTSMHAPPPPPPPPGRSAQFPVPPIVYEQRQRGQKKSAPPPPPPREPMPSFDEFPTSKTRAEQITAGELKVPEYHELQTRSSEVQAIPFERRTRAPGEPRGKSSAAAELRTLLRNRSSLREAILLREILGPPPGLRSARSGFDSRP